LQKDFWGHPKKNGNPTFLQRAFPIHRFTIPLMVSFLAFGIFNLTYIDLLGAKGKKFYLVSLLMFCAEKTNGKVIKKKEEREKGGGMPFIITKNI